MKNIFRIDKLILIICIGFIPLYGIKNQSQDIIINLIKKTDTALYGWQDLKHQWLWSSKASQAEITQKCQSLYKTQKDLGVLLAQVHRSNTHITTEKIDTFILECKQTCKDCALPSHIQRHWASYALSGVALLGSTYILSKHGYDQDGNHLVKNLYTDHIQEPIVNMYNILTKKNQKPTVLVQDSQEALNRFNHNLNIFIEEAKNNTDITAIVNKHIPQDIPLSEVPQQNKLSFLDDIITFSSKESISTIESLHLLSTVRRLKLLGNSGILFAQQIRVEKILATNTVNEISDKMNLTVEFMASIPAMVASYALIKGMYSYSSNHMKKHVYLPLKKLLITFQLQLNKERYNYTPSLYTQGMSIYWLSQLKLYSDRIPTKEQAAYNNYLEQLHSYVLQPEQKITIIESMFKEFEFLQKV